MTIAVAVVALVAGGDDDDSPARDAQDIAADRAAAAAAVLQLADLPDGWDEAPHREDPSGPDINVELADCVSVSRDVLTSPDNPTSVDSPDFSDPETGATVQNAVVFAEDEQRARDAMAVFARPALPDCLAAVMETTLEYSLTHPEPGESPPTGVSFGEVRAVRLPFPEVADEAAALRVTVPIEQAGDSLELFLDLVVLRVGRAGVTLSLTHAGSPFDSGLEEQLASVVVQRLRDPSADPTTTDLETATSTTEADETSTTEVAIEFVTVTDETGAIQVDVPATWSDVTGSSGSEGPVIQASPDREAWYDGWSTPGVWFFASPMYGPADHDMLLDAWAQDACTLEGGRQRYDANLYSGSSDHFVDCAGTGASVVNVVASRPGGTYVVFLHVKMISAADRDALDRILATFRVTGDLGAPDAAVG